MKRNIFVYSALSMALLATFSCSDDNTIADIERSDLGTIDFAPTLDNGGVVTRADNDGSSNPSSSSSGSTATTSTHSTTDLAKGYTVWLENNGNGNLKKSSVATYASSTYTFSPALFWDDISADKGTSTNESDVRKGATVKVWAANFAGRTTTPTVDTEHKFTWTVDQDQATEGYANNDLLVADYIAAQKAIDNSEKQTIPLCFHHAMTKITINVIKGEGFGDAEIAGSTTSITLKGQNTKATIDLSKAVGDGTDSGMISSISENKDVTMKAADSGYTYDNTNKANASFDAIVVEGKELVATSGSATDFAEIKIKSATNTGAYNTYNVKITEAILKAWNNNTAPTDNKLTLKHGVNYVLNVTVKKQGITLTAAIKDWTSYSANATGEISFTGTNTMISDATAEAFTLPFTVYSKTTAKDATYTKGSAFHWVSSDTDNKIGTYDYNKDVSIMYWADNNDARFFRAALYADAKTETSGSGESISYTNTLKDATPTTNDKISSLAAVKFEESKDLIWGTSGETAINPTTSAVKMLFSHALAQVTIKLATSEDASAIDLKNVAKVEITGTKISGGELDFHEGTIDFASSTTAADLTLPNSDNTANAEYKTSETWLVLPQDFAVNTTDKPNIAPKVVITMNDTNADGKSTTYSISLADLHSNTSLKDASGNAITGSTGWKQGEKYEYTITITKQKIDFAAALKDWTVAKGSGNATFEWD